MKSSISSIAIVAAFLLGSSNAKLNLTTSTIIDGKAALQCWQIDLPVLTDNSATGYRLGNFQNTTIFTDAKDMHGNAAGTASLITILDGSVTYPDLNFTLRPGRRSNLLTNIVSPTGAKPPNAVTDIKAPLLVLQQYTYELPPHTVLHGGACTHEDGPHI